VVLGNEFKSILEGHDIAASIHGAGAALSCASQRWIIDER
jgi:hypothetical protein